MVLTRKQIYDMMWTDGVGNTEKTLGLKQTELKMICEKFEIPRPSSGYWTSLKLGKLSPKIALPSSNNDAGMININDSLQRRKRLSSLYRLKVQKMQKVSIRLENFLYMI